MLRYVTVGVNPSAQGPTWAEITNVRVPFLRNLCCMLMDMFFNHIKVLRGCFSFPQLLHFNNKKEMELGNGLGKMQINAEKAEK